MKEGLLKLTIEINNEGYGKINVINEDGKSEPTGWMSPKQTVEVNEDLKLFFEGQLSTPYKVRGRSYIPSKKIIESDNKTTYYLRPFKDIFDSIK